MDAYKCLDNVSKITENIYLSGVNPFNDPCTLNKLNITYILCCVDKKYVEDYHDKIYSCNNNLVILYLPYLDNLDQNLWEMSNNNIDITFFPLTNQKLILSKHLKKLYSNKHFIEIGYNFIDCAVNNSHNILIHCMAGISRSVSVLSYYFMKKYMWNLINTLNFIKTKRIIANPNNNFITQLLKYENKRELYNS